MRHHPRRHRQLLDSLSRERRVRDPAESRTRRQHLPVRRAGVGVRHQGRPVLSLPLSRAAAPGLVPSCAEGGVLGVLPGVIGTIQATEAIKLLLGAPGTLIGRLLLYDAWGMRFRELKLRRDPDCPVCGDHPTVRELIDYDQFCGIAPAASAPPPPSVPADFEITALELKRAIDSGRNPYNPRRAGAAGVPDQPHSRIRADPARPGGLARGRDQGRRRGPSDRGSVQDGRPQRQATQLLRQQGLERAEPQGRSWRGSIRSIRSSQMLRVGRSSGLGTGGSAEPVVARGYKPLGFSWLPLSRPAPRPRAPRVPSFDGGNHANRVSGCAGAYSEMAAQRAWPESRPCRASSSSTCSHRSPRPDFAWPAAHRGTRSAAASIRNYDLLLEHDLPIVAETELQVVHNLMALPEPSCPRSAGSLASAGAGAV